MIIVGGFNRLENMCECQIIYIYNIDHSFHLGGEEFPKIVEPPAGYGLGGG